MSNGMIGHGSAVRIGRGTDPVVYTELALVGDITMPDEVADEVEVTHQKSPGKRKQFIGGLIDGGEVSIPLNHIPGSDTDVLLKAIKTSQEEVLIEITLTADGDAETYAGFCKSYGRTAPIGDKMTSSPVFRLSEIVEVA